MSSTKRGTVVTHRYELIELLHGGWLDDAWKARDRHTGGLVAIKTLPSGHQMRAGRVVHPNIASILDAGQITVNGRATAFLSLPLPEAQTLSQWSVNYGGKPPVAAVVTVISQVAKGLQTLHDAGFVHRQVRPENILVLRDLSTCLIDFGVALRNVDAVGGLPIEVLQYKSPEELGGASNLSGAMDVFSLAVVCYELIAGAHPFCVTGADKSFQYHAIVGAAPPPLLRPFRLGTAIQRGMVKQPEERPTAAQFADQLQEALLAAEGFDKKELLARRERLLDAFFSRALSAREKTELESIEHRLEEIETTEADELDRGYADSRAGKIEAALERLEASIRAGQNTQYRTAENGAF